ncbi:MAG: HAMP domain-containing protein [Vitreoscilla sp.]|nr:HAMP domain-containing protein [Vitreoscilla sp.]
MSSLRFLHELSLRARLLAVALLCMLLALLPSTQLALRYSDDLAFVRAERSALPVNVAWQTTLAAFRQHRELSALALATQPEAEPKRAEAAEQVRRGLDQVATALRVAEASDERLAEVPAIRQTFDALAASVAGRKVDVQRMMKGHREVLVRALDAVGHLNADRALLLDPEADAYFAIVAGLQDSPRVADALSELSAVASAAAVDDVALVAGAVARYLEGADALRHHLERAIVASPSAALKRALDQVSPQQAMVTKTVDDAARDVNYPLPKMAAAFADATALQAKLSEGVLSSIEEALRARDERLTQRRALLLVLIPLLLAAVGLMLWRILRGVLGPVMQTVVATERIAGGDLSEPVPAGQNDEIGRVLNAVGAMQVRLRDLLAEIQRAASSMSQASHEIADGNQDLSRRTEDTASQLQQTASSIESLGATLRNSAATARQANMLANEAADAARRGGNVVEQVVTTIGEIHASSKRIGNIIGVIDGIAFQTNILALNAAVEAARAGESGRGFAVVAAEVRTLAQRSADAAREIKSLIGSSVDCVELGTRLARDAGGSMTLIVDGVAGVSQMIGGIAGDAESQALEMSGVVAAVGEIDRMTQGNAAQVEQSAAASESVRVHAERMRDMVGSFRI